MMDDTQRAAEYFAIVPREELAAQMRTKINGYYRHISGRGLDEVWARVIRTYYGRDPNGFGYKSTLGVSFAGEAGELTTIAANHVRSIVKSLLALTTAERPALQCHATNSDSASYDQAALGNEILEFYLDEGLERRLYQATEYAVVLAEGYLLCTWDQAAGRVLRTDEVPVPGQEDLIAENEVALEEYDIALAAYEVAVRAARATGQVPPEEPEPPDLHEIEYHEVTVHEGDLRFRVLKPEDVIRDPAIEDGQYEWVIVGYRVNKWSLAAQYPEHRDAILDAPSEEKQEGVIFKHRRERRTLDDETDQIYVRELFHLPTPACPAGRHALMVGDEILKDNPMPYRSIPCVEIVPSREIDTGSGYGSVWDLLAPQEIYDAALNTAISNHDTFGLSILWSKPDAALDAEELPFGLQHIKCEEKPEFVSGQAPSNASLDLADRMRAVMELLSGVNEAVRGVPLGTHVPAEVYSNLHSAALTYTSDLQRGVGQAYERAGQLVIEILQDFADEPKIISIAGKSQMPRIRQFVGEDLKGIRRVKIDLAAPNLRTAAGKQHSADLMLQNKVITDPQQYLEVVATGQITPVLERPLAERTLIAEENERLMMGEPTVVLPSDDHHAHIRAHTILLAHPMVRDSQRRRALVQEHIQEHLVAHQTMDPMLAEALGMAPPPPPPPPPGQLPPDAAGAPAPPPGPAGPEAPPPPEPAPAPAPGAPPGAM